MLQKLSTNSGWISYKAGSVIEFYVGMDNDISSPHCQHQLSLTGTYSVQHPICY